MTTEPDDDLVFRLVDITLAALRRAGVNFVPTIRSEIASVVRKEFSGDNVYIPKALGAQKAKRDEAIRRDARPVSDGGLGLSLRALGRKYHMGKSNVARVLAAMAKDGCGR